MWRCARDRRALQQLALNVHVKLSDLTYSERVAYMAAAGFLSQYLNGPLPYNGIKMC